MVDCGKQRLISLMARILYLIAQMSPTEYEYQGMNASCNGIYDEPQIPDRRIQIGCSWSRCVLYRQKPSNRQLIFVDSNRCRNIQYCSGELDKVDQGLHLLSLL